MTWRGWGKYEGDNPAARVRQIRESPGRIRFPRGRRGGEAPGRSRRAAAHDDARRHLFGAPAALGGSAELKNVSPHVRRHTFASRLAMAGVDPRRIQELGGWASLEMVESYTHLSPTHKADAVERIAQNSPTLFTTALKPRRLVTRKPAESQVAPVAQVDRAAVS